MWLIQRLYAWDMIKGIFRKLVALSVQNILVYLPYGNKRLQITQNSR